MEIGEFRSPVGILRLIADMDSLQEIVFVENSSGTESSHPILRKTRKQLVEYFEGERTQFDLPVNPKGTDFQQRVWQVLLDIPYGKTITYLELSHQLGDPNAIRAVGKANGQNPIPIIIPCHRVIGSGGKLVGYSGGIDRKEWLLKHEGALLL